MMYYIVVFSSRTESTAFHEFLLHNGVKASLIPTPRECMTGCGLSVKVDANSYRITRVLLSRFRTKYTLRGIYTLEKRGIRNIVSLVK